MSAPANATRRSRPSPMRQILIGVPLVAFLALAAVLLARLFAGDPSLVPSALIGRDAPDFALAPLDGLNDGGAPVPAFARADLGGGEVTLVNVWASWCVPCRDEHPFLEQLAQDGRFALFGINYKDQPDNARRFLGRYGNPFDAVGVDPAGRVGIDWGVYGVPETFLVDGEGRIAYKHIGPIDAHSLRDRLMPAIEAALSGEAAGS